VNAKHLLAELTRARESLQAAQLLQEKELLADAVSRSYYAVMHAARAALLAHDTIAESHAAVRRLFVEVMVLPGRIEKKFKYHLVPCHIIHGPDPVAGLKSRSTRLS